MGFEVGTKSDKVKRIQELLNRNGVKVEESGVYDDATASAIAYFREGEGLGMGSTLDEETLSRLSGNAAKITDYRVNDSVKKASDTLSQRLAQKPTYTSKWQTQLDDALKKILNREKFSYDLNGDALYQQFKDRYIKQGKLAMQDTIGEAAAMTGGYGNSYAQSVGQQAYARELEELNDIVPQLHQIALDRYDAEGQQMLDEYALLADRESSDYSKYRDEMSDYLNDVDYLTDRYDTERGFDYGKYRDEVADDKWDKEYQLSKLKSLLGGDENRDADPFEYDEEKVSAFYKTLSPEIAHDAIQRKMYGSYSDYVKKMVEEALEKGDIGENEAIAILKEKVL